MKRQQKNIKKTTNKRRVNNIHQESYKNNHYYNTNTSEAFDYDVEEEYYEHVPTRKVKKKIIRRKVKKPEIRYKYDTNKKGKLSFLVYGVIFIIASGCIINLSIYSAMSFKALNLNQLHDDLKYEEEKNSLLKLEISDNYNLAEIEKIAITRLGMTKPQPHQLIHVQIDKSENITHGENVIGNNTINVEKQSFIKSFLQRFIKD